MRKSVEVTIATNCPYKRDNKLGLYCRLGKRNMKRIKKKGKEIIVCFDCEEPDREKIKIYSKG